MLADNNSRTQNHACSKRPFQQDSDDLPPNQAYSICEAYNNCLSGKISSKCDSLPNNEEFASGGWKEKKFESSLKNCHFFPNIFNPVAKDARAKNAGQKSPKISCHFKTDNISRVDSYCNDSIEQKWNLNQNKYILDNFDDAAQPQQPNLNHSAEFNIKTNFFDLQQISGPNNLRTSGDAGLAAANNSFGYTSIGNLPDLSIKHLKEQSNLSRSNQY